MLASVIIADIVQDDFLIKPTKDLVKELVKDPNYKYPTPLTDIEQEYNKEFGSLQEKLFKTKDSSNNPIAPTDYVVMHGRRAEKTKRYEQSGVPTANDFRTIVCKYVFVKSGDFFDFVLENDLPSAIGALFFRPFKQYDMGSILVMNDGGKAAFTWKGHADFQLADNVAQKMHLGHFTMYAKTVVHDNSQIVVAPNAFCRAYLGGNGVTINDPTDRKHIARFKNGYSHGSAFWVPVEANWRRNSFHMSVVGRYPEDLPAGATHSEGTNFTIASEFGKLWGLHAVNGNITASHTSGLQAAKQNVIVFSEHAMLYDPSTKGWTRVARDKGHWSDLVYPGCGRVRDCRQGFMYFKPPKWASTNTVALV